MDRAIGVFDSGIGGLSVLKALRAELPHEHFIYVADSGHAPYGERGVAHVRTRSRAIVQYLVSQNVKALVMACNTATAAAIHLLRAEHAGLALIGVEPALKPAALISQTGRIGVMATRSTLASAKFRALLDSQAGQATFVLQPCDGLAHAIEHSAETGEMSKIIAMCARYTSAMGNFGPEKDKSDTLVLGCTHYPFARKHLCALLGPGVTLVDNGAAVALQTRRLLQIRSPTGPEHSPGQISLFTTGPAQTLQVAARRWLGLPGPVGLLSF
ncbi:glutamate racemase [Polaromonas sp.]|uniref:glutamate racemase n=1 Tax=Polaromonas sp. TaxID=1869339 RepID=UPI00178EF7CF|nr:glutamate racemase [Polaromonas sp.]NML86348.1 glutamate racemase [Polaromonas sp.]